MAFVMQAQENPLFVQGKEAYRADDFQGAIAKWTQILERGQHSASLYYNLGNAHYKLNQVGPSIYYYEKALALDPNNQDVKNNLSFAENAKIDIIEPLPKTFFAKWDEQLSNRFSYDEWAWITVVAFFLFTVLFLSYYFSQASKKKRLLFASSFLCIFLFGTAIIMSFRTYERTMNDRNAIVFAEEIEIKAAPQMKEETVFRLHEGTKVKILATEADWSRIQLLNGKEGWIPSADLKEL